MNMNNDIIVGNYFNKHQSNHFLYRKLVNKYRFTLQSMIHELQISNCMEIGSGEGYIVDYILKANPEIKVVGSDIDYSMVQQAKKTKSVADWCVLKGENLPFKDDSYEMVVACEVLEHIVDPGKVIQELHRVSSRYIVISVPYEPIWRILNMIRLKYLKDFGNTPGHVNHWSKNSIIASINPYFKPIDVRISLPWIFILAEKPRGF